MVKFGSHNINLSYTFRDLICGILVGFRDSFFGIKGIVFKTDKIYIFKNAHHPIEDSSTSVSEKKSRYRKDQSKNLENNDAYYEAFRCAIFNALLFGGAYFVFWGLNYALIKLFHESSWWYSMGNVGVQSVILIPVYIISKATNTFWLMDLSNKAFEKRFGNVSSSSFFPHIGLAIADIIFSLILECLLIVQANILECMLPPWFAQISSVVHYSLLNSLYSFEYLWSKKGWGLHKRISYLETNWPYFIGFGIPLTSISFLIPLNVFFCGLAFAACYPFFIVAAINAPPLTVEQRGPSLKIFGMVIWFTSKVSKGIVKFWRCFREWRSR